MIVFSSLEKKNFIKLFLYRPSVLFPPDKPNEIIRLIIRMICLTTVSYGKTILLLFQGKTSPSNNSVKKKSTVIPIERSKVYKLSLEKLPKIRFISCLGGEFPDINLASVSFSTTSDLAWDRIYPDIENTFSLNRFGWLLSGLVESPSKKSASYAIEKLYNWIESMGHKKNHCAWESYSVAERLANWPFIFRIISELVPLPKWVKEKIETSMISHIDHLISHLELRGEYTNNHIINNARGLYIGGIVLGHEKAVRHAKQIFTEWTGKLFFDDGMLNEHSSHYQLLLSQRYEQVSLLSHHVGEDPEFLRFIDHWSRLISNAARFFFVYGSNGRWTIPLIGDISPDFPPSWLNPDGEAGWSQLKRWMYRAPSFQSLANERSGLKTYSGGFIRYATGPVVLFWHVDTHEMPFHTHGHFDIGSFVFFYDGKQIVADPGCHSYTSKSKHFRSAKAHNTIMIDSLGPYCEERGINSMGVFRDYGASCHYREYDGRFVLHIESNGFKRLLKPVVWKRCFMIEDSRMLIIDELEGKGSNRTETRFQIDPACHIQKNQNSIHIYESNGLTVNLSVEDPHPFRCLILHGDDKAHNEGLFSEEYGKWLTGTTVLFQRELNGSQKHIYEINWQR